MLFGLILRRTHLICNLPAYNAPEPLILQDGFVNAMAFAPSGKFLVAGIGQDHRLGRWQRIKKAKNGVRIILLGDAEENEEEASGDDSA